MTLFIRFLYTLAALWLADNFVDGFSVNGELRGFVIAGVIVTILNSTVRPILKIISGPLIMLSLGLFSLVINAAILWFAANFTVYLTISGITALIWATIVISVINFISNN